MSITSYSLSSDLASTLIQVSLKWTRIFILTTVASSSCNAFTLLCTVNKKYDYELAEIHSSNSLAKWQFSLRIQDTEQSKIIQRCSYSITEKKVTCDSYTADRLEIDQMTRIRKYYFFSSQFDVQVFPDLVFLENNGRGGLATGSCVAQ